MFKTLRRTTSLAAHLRHNHFNAKHMDKCGANFAHLTPISPFKRTVFMYPSKPAYVFEHITRTWGEVGSRVNRFASALHQLGVGRGDVVSVMAPNAPPMYEAHFAVPGIGAVLHSINTRLDVATVVYQLKHSEPKVLIVDNEFTPIMREVIETLRQENIKLPTFISIGDASFTDAISKLDYEDFLKTGDATFALPDGIDEWDAISLNYTSGTTGNPKGVVCHHRGAYLNSVSNIVEWNMEPFAKLFMSKYILLLFFSTIRYHNPPPHFRLIFFYSVVPMFHCNGWNFTWTMANVAGCCFFVRHVRPESIFDIIDRCVFSIDRLICSTYQSIYYFSVNLAQCRFGFAELWFSLVILNIRLCFFFLVQSQSGLHVWRADHHDHHAQLSPALQVYPHRQDVNRRCPAPTTADEAFYGRNRSEYPDFVWVDRVLRARHTAPP